jgi:alkylhydroperoxidase family enzyme
MGMTGTAAAPASVLAGEWGECLLPAAPVPPALRAGLKRKIGAVPDWASRLPRVPWVAEVFTDFIGDPVAYASPQLLGLVHLVVSQDNSCRYCHGVQRAVMKILGHRDEALDRMLRDFQTADLSSADRSALDFARRVSRGHPRPGRADFEALMSAAFSRAALAEIVVMVAAGNFTNRVATFLALPPESLERVVVHPLFRFVRPFMARQMRPGLRKPEAPPPADRPWGKAVASLGDSPSAGAMRRAIDGALASPVLPRRTKALMLAVVGRSLGCSYSEAEARSLLEADGVTRAEVDEVLGSLGSAGLDAREARLIPLARETVRYQTPTIQRRVREACRGLGPEETLEAVGIAALGNALGRLTVALDAC